MSSTLAAPKLSDYFGDCNKKLGLRVLTFSLPAGKTCPGRSTLCYERCYARRHRFRSGNVQRRFARNLKLAKRADFADRVVKVLARKPGGTLVRVSVSGDFFSARYTAAWMEIARRSPHITFWAYTRSWAIPDIEKQLRELAQLPNFQLWYSYDGETGLPRFVPAGVKLAYMQIEPADESSRANLYFRDYPLRNAVAKSVGGTLVCPTENGITAGVTCESCRICFDPTRAHLTQPGRISLL